MFSTHCAFHQNEISYSIEEVTTFGILFSVGGEGPRRFPFQPPYYIPPMNLRFVIMMRTTQNIFIGLAAHFTMEDGSSFIGKGSPLKI